MTNLFNYIPRSSIVHRLTGATKLAALLLLTFASMTSFDTRLLGGMVIFAFAMFGVSKIKLKEVAPVLWFTFVFMVLNNLLIYAFSPEEGVAIYGSLTEISNAYAAEDRINNLRNNLRDEEIESIENERKNYQTSVYYMDIVSEFEKMGDFMINISQSLQKFS